jgi:Protein of unknown function with HXXEE motif
MILVMVVCERTESDSTRLAGRRGSVWLFPATYAFHLTEEYFAGEGFPAWVQRVIGVPLSAAEFVGWNVFAFLLMCVAAALVTRFVQLQWIEIALSIAVLGNATAHAVASLVTQTYSPGLITGALIWVPLGTMRLRAALAVCCLRARWTGVMVGVSVVAVTFAILVAALLRR